LPNEFSSAYMAAKDLRRRVNAEPGSLDDASVRELAEALEDSTHYQQSNARFLYLEISRALAELALLTPFPEIRRSCLEVLKKTACTGNDKAILAAGEALGSLPLDIPRQDVAGPARGGLPHADLTEIAELAGVSLLTPPVFMGRSLVAPVEGGGSLSVKLARKGPGPARALHREAAWMDRLSDDGCPEGLLLPRPVRFKGRYVFRLSRGNIRGAPKRLSKDSLAVAFVAPPGYYEYPNDTRAEKLPAPESFLEIMARSARLLGLLAGRGIMHTAAVPLFHNRIQGARRPDLGIYEWRRMGRLDRWLESSQFPNFGVSGLRDFEHLEPLKQGRSDRPRSGRILSSPELAYRIGDHALGLMLVAGGHFRARDPKLVGLDERGRPVDARRLFDKDLLKRVIEAIFHAYLQGFTGLAPRGPCPVDSEILAERMTEEMGVDKNMEEVIRARDQNEMTGEQFRNLLVSGGFTPAQANRIRRGESDITIMTGPHLGEFNRQTSLPELSLFSATVAGLAVASRFEGSPAF
jgi:hypothetical protein